MPRTKKTTANPVNETPIYQVPVTTEANETPAIVTEVNEASVTPSEHKFGVATETQAIPAYKSDEKLRVKVQFEGLRSFNYFYAIRKTLFYFNSINGGEGTSSFKKMEDGSCQLIMHNMKEGEQKYSVNMEYVCCVENHRQSKINISIFSEEEKMDFFSLWTKMARNAIEVNIRNESVNVLKKTFIAVYEKYLDGVLTVEDAQNAVIALEKRNDFFPSANSNQLALDFRDDFIVEMTKLIQGENISPRRFNDMKKIFDERFADKRRKNQNQ